MADEDKDQKTEEATPRKREEARSRGQVAQSTEFIAAMMLLSTIGSFLVLGPGLGGAIGSLFEQGAQRAAQLARAELSAGQFAALLAEAGSDVARQLAIVAIPILAMGFLTSYGQVGLQLSPKAISVDPMKLNPISGFKKVLGPRGFMRTLLGVLKIAAIGTVISIVTLREIPAVSDSAGTDALTTAYVIGRTVLRASLAGTLVFLVMSLIDLYYQRMQHSRDLRMSKQEIKDEHKSSDGDPQVKARIRQLQREVSSRRMMSDVPDATVVVMNPTHFAVALRYDDERDAAPRVVAKGLDAVALKIREVAEEAGVPIVEEPPLARALHRACDIGDAVPEELFEAVAKLLAYVYRTRERSGARRSEAATAR